MIVWTLGSQLVEVGSRKIGTQTLNILRLFMAVVFSSIVMYVMQGTFYPVGFSAEAWGWLALSGVVGLFIGDMCLFASFVEIGPRLSLLIMSLNAPLSTLLAWMFLSETCSTQQIIGMFVTVLSVAWVIFERKPTKEKLGKRHFRKVTKKGVALAVVGMLGQCISGLLGKHGMGQSHYFQATQIRLVVALAFFVVLFTVCGWWPKVTSALKDRVGMSCVFVTGIFGTAIGIGLSMKAFQSINMAPATTILSLVPIFLIPFAIFIHKEHVSYRAIFGTLLAFAGIFILVNG